VAPSLERVRDAMHRLFIAAEGAALRAEDEQKSREVCALLPHLAKIKRGAHLVDAAAGKASVGLVAAELLGFERLTILERDPKRVAACRAATLRLSRPIPVDVREADVGDLAAWPREPDAVVALHACGPAADLVIAGAAAARARQLLLAPCCYGRAIPFHAGAARAIANLRFAADELLARRMAASLIDLERKLRLEVAGYDTKLCAFVAPTVTPHDLLFVGWRTDTPARVARAEARLAALRAAAGSE